MASRLPLVMVNGVPQQIPPGDNLNVPIAQTDVRSLTNADTVALVCGTPVYMSAADNAKRAQANASATAQVIGLVSDASVAVSASGQVAVGGVLALTTAQWDAVVTGETGGLTFGALYYVDPSNPGKLTTTAPTTVGQFVAPIGRALSTTEMQITPTPWIIGL